MRFIFSYSLIAISLLASFSCSESTESENKINIDEKKLKQQIEKVQKPVIVMENDIINSFLKQHQLSMQTTGTGLRYKIVKSNSGGKNIQSLDEIKIVYKVSLLDGTLCYKNDFKSLKKVKVDYENIESGLHEGLKLMRLGEKAILILPSHLAHGVTGDNDKIPPKSPVYYEIEVVN